MNQSLIAQARSAGWNLAAHSSATEKNHVAHRHHVQKTVDQRRLMRSFERIRKSVELAVRWWPRASAWALVALLFSSVFTVFNLLMAVLLPLSEFGLFSYGQSLDLVSVRHGLKRRRGMQKSSPALRAGPSVTDRTLECLG